MPRNRKFFPNKSVILVTARTETGLPMPPTLNMNFILWGVLARARTLYNVKVCHFIFLANHFHMLIVIDTPEDVSNFVGYIKCESAHAVNKLLGRKQRTIWCDGYDSPIILTPRDVIRYIRYIYLNAARANLVESIGDYPGVSSWHMFTNGICSKICKRLSRQSIVPLWSPQLSIAEQKRLVTKWELQPMAKHVFYLEPNAWIECFEEVSPEDIDKINLEIIKQVEETELELKRKRVREKRGVMGATALRRQSMTKEYEPKKHSPRMICLCSDKALRGSFIELFKSLSTQARRVYESWRVGQIRAKIPPGMFAPCMPSLASALALTF